MTIWKSYKPTEDSPWNVSRVMHLHRRCVFGASRAELKRDLEGDPQDAVTRVLSGNCRLQGVPTNFEQVSALLNESAVGADSPLRLKAWWVYRMLNSPHPLQERMTLMWHNHFATSNLKVKNLRQMNDQNQVLRQNALGSFAKLLHGVLHDPAMLRWLDAPSNRRGQPNENLARELLELFTLGVGNFSEQDVSETARALTGWTIKRGKASYLQQAHDPDQKTILGKSGEFDKDDLHTILVNHPATSERIAWRLANEFFGESKPNELTVSKAAIQELAEGLRQRELDTRWATETILRSELFFKSENIGSRICDPATYLIAPLRAVESWRWTPSTPVLAGWLIRFGHDLFYPPNVGGWSGGRSWLATRTVIARSQYAEAIATGQLANPPQTPKLEDLFGANAEVGATKQLSHLLLGSDVEKGLAAESLNEALTTLLSSPEAHVH